MGHIGYIFNLAFLGDAQLFSMFVLLLYRHIDGATPYIIFCAIQIVTPYKIQMNVGYIMKITPRL